MSSGCSTTVGCEFRSLRRRRRFNASEINSVRLDEDTIEVRYRDRKLRLLETDDFEDFLARLKRLNPAVEVDGPEKWASRLLRFDEPSSREPSRA